MGKQKQFEAFFSELSEKGKAQDVSEPNTPEEPEVIRKAEPGTAPEPFIKIKKTENRTARLQVLLRPSLKAKLKQRADIENVTVNELINQILEQTL